MYYIKSVKENHVRIEEAKSIDIFSIDYFPEPINHENVFSIEANFWENILSVIPDYLKQDLQVTLSDIDFDKIFKYNSNIAGIIDCIIYTDVRDVKCLYIPSQIAYITNDKGATLHTIKANDLISVTNQEDKHNDPVFGTNNLPSNDINSITDELIDKHNEAIEQLDIKKQKIQDITNSKEQCLEAEDYLIKNGKFLFSDTKKALEILLEKNVCIADIKNHVLHPMGIDSIIVDTEQNVEEKIESCLMLDKLLDSNVEVMVIQNILKENNIEFQKIEKLVNNESKLEITFIK